MDQDASGSIYGFPGLAVTERPYLLAFCGCHPVAPLALMSILSAHLPEWATKWQTLINHFEGQSSKAQECCNDMIRPCSAHTHNQFCLWPTTFDSFVNFKWRFLQKVEMRTKGEESIRENEYNQQCSHLADFDKDWRSSLKCDQLWILCDDNGLVKKDNTV